VTLDDYKRVLDLLEQAPKPPEARPPEGAAPGQIDAAERQIGYSLPASLRDWLSLCNGYIAGPGVLYGARPDYGALDLASAISLWPEWRSRRWVPVASDGTGNAYLVDAADSDFRGAALAV